MNFAKNQTFTLTTDDNKELVYTIKDIDERGWLLVHSSLLEKAYFVTAEAFEDFLWVIGWQEPIKYRIWLVNFGWYMQDEYETFDQAIEVAKHSCFDSRIDLGGMVCATWSYFGGLRVMTEYQTWAQDQQYILTKVEGSYP